MPMRRHVFMLTALVACAPGAEHTPRIDVEPHPAQRVCYACLAAEKRDAEACPPDVASICAELSSDLKRPAVRWTDGAED